MAKAMKATQTTTTGKEEKADKSVRFAAETDRKFTALALKTGRSKQELFALMVDYFHKSKKDPADLNDELLKKEISQGISRIIAFMKTQEKDALAPLLAGSMSTEQQFGRINEWRNSLTVLLTELLRTDGKQTGKKVEMAQGNYWQAIGELRKVDTSIHKSVLDAHRDTQRILNEITAQRQDKEALKGEFEAILENYITQRDALNSLTQGKQIRELQQFAARQLENM